MVALDDFELPVGGDADNDEGSGGGIFPGTKGTAGPEARYR